MSNIDQCSKCRRCEDSYSCEYYTSEDPTPCLHYERPIDNSKFMGRFFLWTGRIGRLEYIVTILVAVFAYFALAFYLGAFHGSILSSMNIYIILILLMLPSIYIIIVAGIKRCNDSRANKWFSIAPIMILFFIGLIPLIFGALAAIYLLFTKGEDSINEHGTIPLEDYSSQIY